MTLKTSIAAALLMAALSTPAISADRLSTAELHGLAPGSYAVSVMGLVNMTVNLKPGGGLSGVTSKKKRDSGVWSVRGERLCVQFNRWLKGKQRCAALSGDNGSYSGGGLWIRKI
jgi:hypothetical protein